MDRWGQGREVYGLIHGDLGLDTNLLFWGGQARAIDFDDSGYGYYLYDLPLVLEHCQGDASLPRFREALRGKKLAGVKFRRQQPIGLFVVDFYAPSLRLVIEVDGEIHGGQKEQDRMRQDILEELGLIVLRLPANLVEKNLKEALRRINAAIHELGPQIPLSPVGNGLPG